MSENFFANRPGVEYAWFNNVESKPGVGYPKDWEKYTWKSDSSKAHITLGLTLFVVFPFSRLVHIWSGFGAVAYLTRAYQIVRSR